MNICDYINVQDDRIMNGLIPTVNLMSKIESSGDAVYMKSRDVDGFFTLPRDLRWNGTVVALRIPYQVPKFNYINYIE